MEIIFRSRNGMEAVPYSIYIFCGALLKLIQRLAQIIADFFKDGGGAYIFVYAALGDNGDGIQGLAPGLGGINPGEPAVHDLLAHRFAVLVYYISELPGFRA